ncbi:YchJ family metal-binding protein [Cellulosimicrobium funkei]|uniref:YchJ family protein n=1 Tax=Cellulosimicrobium funkei TaxID=264251 RepID=UPI0020404C62|nr:YchJ family metal-binding protein [Cellulosimicrobium funkei]MCM3533787.1 YchJ family metal-binding protein [Cellulosimicrobium funkei]
MTGNPLDDGVRCPCLSGDTYGSCCGRYHAGLRPGPDGTAPGPHAPTAEALMRSRYSAFAVGDADYLLATWHAAARPADLELDDDVEWRRLDVVRTEAGGPFDTTGVVEFVAHHRSRTDPADRGRLHEVSRFVREGDRWSYVDGAVQG